MAGRVSIGDFAVMTHLSRKALRHYHEMGLLVPAHIDAHTGYRFYDTCQVDHARIIRRFRELDMPIPDIKALLAAGDGATRNEIIAAHLRRMEEQLAQTRDAVTELRELLDPVRVPAHIEVRHQPATEVWAVSAEVHSSQIGAWFAASVDTLQRALSDSGVRIDGAMGGVYDRELFAGEGGVATLYVPVPHTVPVPPTVQAQTVPAQELAVLMHPGSQAGIDRSYGELGAYVYDHLISHQGPIRERYVGAPASNIVAFTATEIGWPILATSPSQPPDP
ncbi:MerR family transcriptional regulator [Mycolicibacterium smegmatis]|uniref:MerR family transcriptional regulator n=1 Tax=Mycolicibacterium smegmatis TaxID=1772 RepID=UPI001E5A3C78|nr:MerR family transcriptional regulator [Mycolicibacterium smegmatis]UGU32427.1 MerR family transcriptional regulator [Mycolicibacterium smegmatis]ULN73303.1 MerR family transcriptional regulator [Mycolicibacterium smegmatis]